MHKEMKPPKSVEAGAPCFVHGKRGQTFGGDAVHHACGCPVLRGEKRMDREAVEHNARSIYAHACDMTEWFKVNNCTEVRDHWHEETLEEANQTIREYERTHSVSNLKLPVEEL